MQYDGMNYKIFCIQLKVQENVIDKYAMSSISFTGYTYITTTHRRGNMI